MSISNEMTKQPTSGRSWIVCWALEINDINEDLSNHWKVFESYLEAKAHYNRLWVEVDALYSATLCAVIASTDYEPHLSFQ